MSCDNYKTMIETLISTLTLSFMLPPHCTPDMFASLLIERNYDLIKHNNNHRLPCLVTLLN